MPYVAFHPVFDAATLTLAQADITNCRQRLPFLINLTAKQRKAHLKLGKTELAFITKAIMHYRQNPLLAVPYLPLAQFENDWATYERLEQLHLLVKVLENDLAHTIIAVKQSCLESALGFYKSAKKASQHNVPGIDSIVTDLQEMMPGFKKGKKQPENSLPKRQAYVPPATQTAPNNETAEP